jgi:hypothetical protein
LVKPPNIFFCYYKCSTNAYIKHLCRKQFWVTWGFGSSRVHCARDHQWECCKNNKQLISSLSLRGRGNKAGRVKGLGFRV